jgi:K+ transporter
MPAAPRAQLLLSLVLLMTSLVLGDGVLTPAQSGQCST